MSADADAAAAPAAAGAAAAAGEGQSYALDRACKKYNTAEDVATIVDALRSLPSLRHVQLGGNTYGVDACVAIAAALAEQHDLAEADLADIFTTRLTSEIPPAVAAFAAALSNKQHLHTVNVADNAFGPFGAKPLQSWIAQGRWIRTWDLNNLGLGIAGAKLIAEALVQLAATNTAAGAASALETLVIGRNRLETDGVTALAPALQLHTNLRCVRMPQDAIRPEGIATLLDALRACPLLEEIDLNDNIFTEKGSTALAAALPSWPRLKVLDVGDCLLGAAHGPAVIRALTDRHAALERLNLAYNELDKTAAALLPTMLANKTRLASLELSGNAFPAEGLIVALIQSALDAHGHGDALGELEDMESEDGSGSGSDADTDSDAGSGSGSGSDADAARAEPKDAAVDALTDAMAKTRV
ncbi:hypothetical protein CXG81DRAFT_12807 [Caulochytrium protostelioides]|uniref:RNI-like protein n=1 Tax=Caulochytrium protostelioides TaxID=1555241 RepID=A0A4P9X6I3_9FUNG|nr:hypothetical protein CXG81DRAFT_12807 [Caulochytrium protostelioides]|eukprot:RKP00806.1 hypothetical protein CXG81DRAFT_12807 [Caulochytrium protostelioides]